MGGRGTKRLCSAALSIDPSPPAVDLGGGRREERAKPARPASSSAIMVPRLRAASLTLAVHGPKATSPGPPPPPPCPPHSPLTLIAWGGSLQLTTGKAQL